jgi:hypothetical protein
LLLLHSSLLRHSHVPYINEIIAMRQGSRIPVYSFQSLSPTHLPYITHVSLLFIAAQVAEFISHLTAFYSLGAVHR